MPLSRRIQRHTNGNARSSSDSRATDAYSESGSGDAPHPGHHSEGLPIVIAPKKNDIRSRSTSAPCTSISYARYTTRQHYFRQFARYQRAWNFFTVVDSLKGYHQVPLDAESIDLTSFSTLFGRYQYKRLPFGVVHARDDYDRQVVDVFDDMYNCRRIVEDILIYSETYVEHLNLVNDTF